MKINYVKCGDYYIPDLKLPDEKEYQIGKYGSLRRTFLKEHHKVTYQMMMLDGTLFKHLEDIDKAAHNLLVTMMPKMMKNEGVTEELKATDQMLWVQKVNSIKHRIEEIIYNDYVYGGFEE